MAPPDSDGRTERRVLVVDDDVDSAGSLQDMLETNGYTVATAHTVAEAQAIGRQFLPHVALLDVNLGRDNGLTLISLLKQIRPDLLSVVISARAATNTAIEALRRGAFDYLLKPLHATETFATLDKCFDKLWLEQRANAAEAMSRARSAFLATVSHELRTPLNAIIGFSEILRCETFGPVGSNRYRQYAQDIHESGTHLLSLINAILDTAKAEAGKLNIQEELIDLGDIARTSLRFLEPRAATAELQLESRIPDKPQLFRGDEVRIKQIILNLLSNAVKFTPSGGRVVLIVDQGDDGGFRLIVEDTGIGMAPGDIPRVLEPFSQVDNGLSRKYEGTGLGLPLSVSLVEMHGGQLGLESELGAGTRVTVRFPPARTVRGFEAQERGPHVSS
jgi:signal transduction histidine kinase